MQEKKRKQKKILQGESVPDLVHLYSSLIIVFFISSLILFSVIWFSDTYVGQFYRKWINLGFGFRSGMSGIYKSEICNRRVCFRDMHIHISIMFLNFTTVIIFRASYFVCARFPCCVNWLFSPRSTEKSVCKFRQKLPVLLTFSAVEKVATHFWFSACFKLTEMVQQLPVSNYSWKASER